MNAITIDTADFAGWVHKQGSVVPTWKTRFLILRGSRVAYYDTAKVTSNVKEKGSLTVLSVEQDADIATGLLIHGTGGKILRLYTDYEDTCHELYTALQRSIQSLNQISTSLDSISRTTLMTSSTESTDVNMCGFLYKQGHLVKSWKRRYFILKGTNLSYYVKSNNGASAKGSGHVTGVQIWEHKPFSLNIYFAAGRLLRVSANSQDEMLTWFDKLSQVVEGNLQRDRRLSTNDALRSQKFDQVQRATVPTKPEAMEVPQQSVPTTQVSDFESFESFHSTLSDYSMPAKPPKTLPIFSEKQDSFSSWISDGDIIDYEKNKELYHAPNKMPLKDSDYEDFDHTKLNSYLDSDSSEEIGDSFGRSSLQPKSNSNTNLWDLASRKKASDI